MNKFGLGVKLISIAFILAMIAAAVVVYGASPGNFLLCIFVYIIYVMLPGLMLYRILKIEGLHISTMLVSSFFLGWALCVLLIYLCSLIKTDWLFILAGPLLGACLMRSIFLDKQKRPISYTVKDLFVKTPASFYFFFALAMLFCLVGTQYQYLVPPKGDFAFISGDRAYHMGLANAISHKLPLESIWIKGIRIKYHIFTDILFSIPIKLFGVRADAVGQLFSPVLTASLVCTSLYSFFKEMADKPKRAGIYCVLFLLSSAYITRRWTSSIAFKFIFTNDNYAGFALAALLPLVIVFTKWYGYYEQNKSDHYRYLFAALVFIALITGIKGPVAAVFVAALWATIILGIILRKIPVKAIAPASILTAGFLGVYVSVLGASGQVNTAGGATLSFGDIMDIAFWKSPLVNAMKDCEFTKPARLMIVLAVFAAFFFTAFLIPFFAGCLRELILVLTGKKEYIPARILVYALALVGFAAMMLFSFTGHNQIYFGLVTVVMAPIIAFWYLEDLEESAASSARAKIILKTTISIMAVTFVLTTISLTGYFIRRGTDAIGYANQDIPLSRYAGVSRAEYEAMIWIDQNTEKDAILANDRYYSVPLEKYRVDNRWDSSFFMYEVYSNRFSYISGSAYDLDVKGSKERKARIQNNVKLYDPDNTSRGSLARTLGIDYIILSKRFSGNLNLRNDDYELCFSNEDVDIYKVAD